MRNQDKKQGKAASKSATVKAGPKKTAPMREAYAKETPKEHQFADSPFAEEITMHTGIRMFTVSVLYTLIADSDNPLMDAVREQVQINEHLVQLAIAGPGDINAHAADVYPTLSAYRSRHAEMARSSDSRHEIKTISDPVADYYGILAAERLVRETNGQARILAVDVEEHMLPAIFLNAIAG